MKAKINMQEIIQQYIKLCSLLSNNPEDLTDKKKIKKHNDTMKKLFSLREQLKKDKVYAKEIMSKLLDYQDEQILLIAASQSIALGVCEEKAIKILHWIMDNSKDGFNDFEAKMILKHVKPQ